MASKKADAWKSSQLSDWVDTDNMSDVDEAREIFQRLANEAKYTLKPKKVKQPIVGVLNEHSRIPIASVSYAQALVVEYLLDHPGWHSSITTLARDINESRVIGVQPLRTAIISLDRMGFLDVDGTWIHFAIHDKVALSVIGKALRETDWGKLPHAAKYVSEKQPAEA